MIFCEIPRGDELWRCGYVLVSFGFAGILIKITTIFNPQHSRKNHIHARAMPLLLIGWGLRRRSFVL